MTSTPRPKVDSIGREIAATGSAAAEWHADFDILVSPGDTVRVAGPDIVKIRVDITQISGRSTRCYGKRRLLSPHHKSA
jgi:hypothetical protein